MTSRFFLLGLCTLFLGACGLFGDDGPKPPPPRSAREQMIGMTESEIPVCLGQPSKIRNLGTSQIWIYHYSSCELDLRLQNKRVVTDSVTIVADGDFSMEEQCFTVPEVGSCLRWLRSDKL